MVENLVTMHSLERKQDHFRAVHCKPGPLGKFVAHCLQNDIWICYVGKNNNGTADIEILIDPDYIGQFQESTGFGLTE